MLNIPLIFSLILLMQTADISITSPQAGDTLRGQMEITGKMDAPNFASAELSFSYAPSTGDASNPAVTLRSNSEQGWFTIQTFPQPVQSSTLAIWDTTLLTDGDYVLHLRVFFQDGSSQDVVVSDLKIRNDEPTLTVVPTLTETPTESVGSITINPIATSFSAGDVTVQPAPATPAFPSLTPLPANPVAVTTTSIYSNFARGALVTLVLFVIFSLLLRLRKT